MTVEPKQTKFNVKEEILEKAKKIKKICKTQGIPMWLPIKVSGFPGGHPSRY